MSTIAESLECDSARLAILSVMSDGRERTHDDVARAVAGEGFSRVRISGALGRLSQMGFVRLSRNQTPLCWQLEPRTSA